MVVLVRQTDGSAIVPGDGRYGRLRQAFEAAIDGVESLWRQASLSQKFAAISSMILLFGMYLVGQWVSVEVTRSAVQTRAAAAVLYINSVVQPSVQALGSGGDLSASDRAAIDAAIADEFGERLISGFRIWSRDSIVFSDHKEMIGRVFKPDSRRERAWAGEVVADLKSGLDADGDGVSDDGDPVVNQPDQLLEIYAPIRQTGSNRIIAVAETYERVPSLVSEIRRAQFGSWFVVANIGLIMFAWQLSVVHKGTQTINQQRLQLNARIDDLTTMLTENTELRHANRAAIRATEMNEHYLRRVGADLHDGPLQLIGATMFRLDSLDGVVSGAQPQVAADAREDIEAMRDAIATSLKELRDMAAGFMLPEIEALPLADAIAIAAERHERRTRQQVRIELTDAGAEVASALKVCLYRFVQEALTNAHRHGKCPAVTIEGHIGPDSIEVSVQDDGPGFDLGTTLASRTGLGLYGLRDRVESLGGVLTIASAPGAGTRLSAHFSSISPLTEGDVR